MEWKTGPLASDLPLKKQKTLEWPAANEEIEAAPTSVADGVGRDDGVASPSFVSAAATTGGGHHSDPAAKGKGGASAPSIPEGANEVLHTVGNGNGNMAAHQAAYAE